MDVVAVAIRERRGVAVSDVVAGILGRSASAARMLHQEMTTTRQHLEYKQKLRTFRLRRLRTPSPSSRK